MFKVRNTTFKLHNGQNKRQHLKPPFINLYLCNYPMLCILQDVCITKEKRGNNDTVLLKEEEKRGAEILLPFNDKKNF